MRTFYGIDPGVSGGIAKMEEGIVMELRSFQDLTMREMVELFDEIFPGTIPHPYILLEQLQPLPSFIRGCKASWVLAENYSMIKTMLTVKRVPFVLVRPIVWQTEFGLVIPKTKSKKKIDKKKLNREKAQQLFPRVDFITKDTADALLIAEYSRRLHQR